MRLRLPNGDNALVALFGAQVLSWETRGCERLYLSPRSAMDGRLPIRGGVPVCFPQFNQRGTLPKHGMARRSLWQLVDATCRSDDVTLNLQWQDDEATRALWPQAFVANLLVTLAPDQLRVCLQVHNTDTRPLQFTGALHTYLAVEDITRVIVRGLAGQPEWDAVTDQHGQAAASIAITDEFDRVYTAAPGPVWLEEGRQRLQIEQSHTWAQQVIWNPGPAKGAALPDMPEDGYRQMLCIEAAQVDEPITVPAGAQWQGWQLLSLA